jgi:hypothetical protein
VPDVSRGVREGREGARRARAVGAGHTSGRRGSTRAAGGFCVLAVLLSVAASSSSAGAAPARARNPSAAVAVRPAKGAPSSTPARRAAALATAAPTSAPGVTPVAGASAPAETRVQSSVPSAQRPPATDVVKTEEARRGEKTYTFGAQEVEGRLKSPQILYFLRRVRAQFDPAPLGHRSFMLELSDTRRNPALE